MRLDRLITLNLVQPLRRALMSLNSQPSTPDKFPVPVLMYHNISDDPEPGVSAYYKTNTSPAVFRQHMQYLADTAYQTITLDQVVAALRHPSSIIHHPPSSALHHSTTPFRSVVITFDDGFRSFYTEAFPVLQQYGFTATVFLPTAFIAPHTPGAAHHGARSTHHASRTTSASRLSFKGQECLTWTEVTELRREGIHFGSHTVNHPALVELDWPAIKSELSDSKSDIEHHLGEPITAFCYPFAFPQGDRAFARTFRNLVLETGYTSCAATSLGRVRPGKDPFSLNRLPANSLDDAALFAAKLEGAYDWLGFFQSLTKQLRGRRQPPPEAQNARCDAPASSRI